MKDDMNSLTELRKNLDDIDDKLLELLVKRFKIIFLIGQHKKENQIPMMQNHRVDHVINKSKSIAEKNNLNPKFFERIYQTIIDVACDMEDEIIDE